MEDEVYDEHMTGQAPDYDDGDNMVMTNGEKKVIITDKAAKTVKGRNFAYEINGLQIFAMGADYIPEDNIFNPPDERTYRSAVKICTGSKLQFPAYMGRRILPR